VKLGDRFGDRCRECRDFWNACCCRRPLRPGGVFEQEEAPAAAFRPLVAHSEGKDEEEWAEALFSPCPSPAAQGSPIGGHWRCCRRRRPEADNLQQFPCPRGEESPSAPRRWREPDDPDLAAEWRAVQRSVNSEELQRLRDFRLAVEGMGLDSHPACARTPYSQRAATLLRFLRARQGDSVKARALFAEALDWRRDYDIDRKLKEWRAEWAASSSQRVRLVQAHDFVGNLGRDREGMPVYLYRFSQGDPGGIVREAGEETLLLHMVNALETSFEEAQARMLQTGRLINGFVEVYDVGNYGIVGGYLPRAMAAIGPYSKFAPIFDKVYPERIRLVFLVRAPQAFSIIWRLAQPLVPPATKAKIRLRGFRAATWLEEMEAALPTESIPLWLRIDDPAEFKKAKPFGGFVPNSAATAAKTCGK